MVSNWIILGPFGSEMTYFGWSVAYQVSRAKCGGMGRGGVQPWGSGEGLIIIESMAKKDKESVTGGGVHINETVFQM